jgi:hypothetical protein
MATLQGYEIIDQTAFRIQAARSRQAILRADYGEGHADTASVGYDSGQKRFVATAGVWPKNAFYGTIATKTWMDYYWDFLNTRLQNGNEPFVISVLGKYWLVDMDDPETAVECVRCDNFDLFVPAQIALSQRRMADVEENADGSMVEP